CNLVRADLIVRVVFPEVDDGIAIGGKKIDQDKLLCRPAHFGEPLNRVISKSPCRVHREEALLLFYQFIDEQLSLVRLSRSRRTDEEIELVWGMVARQGFGFPNFLMQALAHSPRKAPHTGLALRFLF